MKDQIKHAAKERQAGAQDTPGLVALAEKSRNLGAYGEGLPGR